MISMIGYIFTLIFAFTGNGYHPVHVSILNVEHNTTKATLDFSLKVYTADLELAIAHNYEIALNLGKSTESPKALLQLQTYMGSAMGVIINNQPIKFSQIQKKEIDGDATRLFFSIPLRGTIKTLIIKDKILMDVFEDQTNLVIVVMNGKEQGYRQTIGSTDITIKN